MTTGENIAALRREKGFSQEALGEKLGLSRQAVSKWESDQAVPTMDNLVELSRLFGVPVDTLLRPDEPLPGKEQQPPEGVKLSAEGLKISYAPVLTRKTKWFIIALAMLILVSVLGNIYAMARVQSLEEQLRALQMQAQPQDAESVVKQESIEEDALSDYDIAYDLYYNPNKTITTTLELNLSARPKELNQDAEIPKFTIQSAGESWTCAAILEQDNSYVGSTEIPMRDAFTVYLTLTHRESGAVRNLLLGTLSGISNEYRLQFDGQWLNAQGEALMDGSAITSENGSTTIRGWLQYRFYNAWSDRFRAYPVKCRLVLREGDTELKSMEMSAVEYNEENGQYYAYCRPDWTVPKSFEDLELIAEATDSYGRVHEWHIYDYAIEKAVP